MRHTSGPAVNQGVEALDQRDFVRPLAVLEVPAMVGVGLDTVRLPTPVGIDERRRDEVRVRDRVSVRDSQGVFVDCLDGTPYLGKQG